MPSSGWEIRPAGWLLLFMLAVLLIHVVIHWLPDASKTNPEII
jgi:hypothetical protein